MIYLHYSLFLSNAWAYGVKVDLFDHSSYANVTVEANDMIAPAVLRWLSL